MIEKMALHRKHHRKHRVRPFDDLTLILILGLSLSATFSVILHGLLFRFDHGCPTNEVNGHFPSVALVTPTLSENDTSACLCVMDDNHFLIGKRISREQTVVEILH